MVKKKTVKKSLWGTDNSIWGNVRKPKPTSKKSNLSWARARLANPRLKPTADSDRDGVMNFFDCRPLNRKKQGAGHPSYRDMNEESNFESMRTTNDEEQKLIKEVLERARMKKKVEKLEDNDLE